VRNREVFVIDNENYRARSVRDREAVMNEKWAVDTGTMRNGGWRLAT
jgi:hypothetical protein